MPLHPEAQAIVSRAAIQGQGEAPATQPSAAEMREQFRQVWSMPDDLPSVGGVVDTVFPGPAGEVPIRVYTPEGEGPFPVFVWFHGGGWTIGSLDENEVSCRTVCAGANVVVVSVDYRLAPENPYPAAADDCYAAVRWVHENPEAVNADPSRIAVGGESAGGNLAAVAALMARDLGGPRLALQVLVSPVLGHPDDGRASYRDCSEGYFLSKASMDWFFTTYPRDARDLEDPYLLPLRAKDLSGLPPAVVLGAEYDVLRDEGEDYAEALRAAGVPVDLVRYEGLIHGFFGLLSRELSDSAKAHRRVIDALRAAYAKGDR
ncbi:putative lipase/esterase [Sphaerisporangium siamense]|uniref:Acetyl esterase n=1 Tax=Sphaerisporangium siamense TaxID=795645 RepID=A0A7W7G8I5_9ACTN|nr:alpha/beta hydrolase [Sphaerisporangium siamense]MBB4701828.1 acetyl esterase [Sphaerisporangium siamense]GII84264.1 putative lipase/esterase [Sphaerisporangium siamense]